VLVWRGFWGGTVAPAQQAAEGESGSRLHAVQGAVKGDGERMFSAFQVFSVSGRGDGVRRGFSTRSWKMTREGACGPRLFREVAEFELDDGDSEFAEGGGLGGAHGDDVVGDGVAMGDPFGAGDAGLVDDDTDEREFVGEESAAVGVEEDGA